MIILIIAAALRFTGLTHGLRHTPLIDERFFVEGSARMLSQGTLDPGFYEYPGLLMYILCLPLVFLAPEHFYSR
ncbi:MAG: hypothetical protein MUF51_09665, partial [Vicinamibacteria bacterium]|nr:hypothetical protein [Vicinamibacteria bacterium]